MKVYVETANKRTVNFRSEPSQRASIITQIPYATVLDAEPYNDEWYKVTYNNRIGYIMSRFLSPSDACEKNELMEIYQSLQSALTMIEKLIK